MTEISKEEQALLQLNNMALQDQATVAATDIMRQLKALQNQMKSCWNSNINSHSHNNKRERDLGKIYTRGGEEDREEA